MLENGIFSPDKDSGERSRAHGPNCILVREFLAHKNNVYQFFFGLKFNNFLPKI